MKRTRQRRKVKRCNTCGAQCPDAYMCQRCGRELRELLIGSGQEAIIDREHDRAQPGIVWYIKRLEETAYRQTVLDKSIGVRSSSAGYALLVDRNATKLLARINATLAAWSDTTETLSPDRPLLGMDTTGGTLEALSIRRARFIAFNIRALRTQCKDIEALHGSLLNYAKEAWRVINRPADNCCGPCPTILVVDNEEEECSTILYAEENAKTVMCPRCHVMHSVHDLREALKNMVHDMLFEGKDLRVLMETRLNDRISKSTFYGLLRDGRLKPRTEKPDGTMMFTYDDVCAARELSKPTRKANARSAK